jgi:putative membrane protein
VPLLILGLGLVLVTIAALIHVSVFVLESLTWTTPRTRAVFGVRSVEEAETMRLLAFNQGFYNLFLGVGTLVGVVLVLVGAPGSFALGMIVLGAASMAAAGVVLAASQPKLLRAALIQLLPPALGLAAIVLALLIGWSPATAGR